MQTPNTDVVEQRKIRNAKYAVEDFQDAVKSLYKSSIMHAILFFFLGISLALDANNLTHLVFSLIVAIACVVAANQVSFYNKNNIFLGLGLYFFILVLEFAIGGVPDPISPALADHKRWEGGAITRTANALSPYFYIGLRLIFFFPFISMLNKLDKLKAQPKSYLGKAGFDAGVLID